MMPVAACIPAAAGITTLLTASVLRSSGYVGASLSMTYTGAEHVFKSGYTCCCIPAGELLSRKRRHRVVRGPDAGTRPRAGEFYSNNDPEGPKAAYKSWVRSMMSHHTTTALGVHPAGGHLAWEDHGENTSENGTPTECREL